MKNPFLCSSCSWWVRLNDTRASVVCFIFFKPISTWTEPGGQIHDTQCCWDALHGRIYAPDWLPCCSLPSPLYVFTSGWWNQESLTFLFMASFRAGCWGEGRSYLTGNLLLLWLFSRPQMIFFKHPHAVCSVIWALSLGKQDGLVFGVSRQKESYIGPFNLQVTLSFWSWA